MRQMKPSSIASLYTEKNYIVDFNQVVDEFDQETFIRDCRLDLK